MFITGGVNAYPAEIENFLMTHPKISMVSVVGVPDRRMQEVAMAFVKLKEGQTATAEEIIASPGTRWPITRPQVCEVCN